MFVILLFLKCISDNHVILLFMPKKVISVVGARPQFIKAAPLEMVFREIPDFEFISIHTGQHYDENMSQVFFNDFGL